MSWTVFALLLCINSLVTAHIPEWYAKESRFNIPGGFFGFRRDNSSAAHTPFPNTCYELARGFEEPSSSRFRPRSGLSFADFPRVAWRWDGPILRKDFDAALALRYQLISEAEDVVHYKILSGRLWVSTNTKPMPSAWFREHAEEMLTVALYLYPDLPDMEVLLYFGDGCIDAPVFQWNVCREKPRAGFAMPTFSVWSRALGRLQMAAYHACLGGRYPAKDRIPKVVWRGSTTGVLSGPVSLETCKKLPRVQLHELARRHPQLLDVGLHKLLQACEATLKPVVTDLLPSIPEEDYNKYCVILDVDGNGWSNRFVSMLVHYPTPVLKQASNATGAFEELYAPGVAVEHFAPDFSDLVQRAAELVEDCRAQQAAAAAAAPSPSGSSSSSSGGGVGRRLAGTMQATSRHLLDHVGIAEGVAYLLSVYAKLTYWRLNTSTEGFVPVDRRRCCVHAQLPPPLQADIRYWAETGAYRTAQEAADPAAATASSRGAGAINSLLLQGRWHLPSSRQALLYLLLGGNLMAAAYGVVICSRWRHAGHGSRR